jgi:hypothetical protein
MEMGTAYCAEEAAKRLLISSQDDGGFYMCTNNFGRQLLRPTSLIFRLCVLCLVAAVPVLRAQSDDEFDSYKLKLEGFWVYASPSGSLQSSVQTATGPIDLQKDLGFNNYSTFAGKLDWKFTHKNHFYIGGEAFKSSRQTVLTRTITFQGQTFEAGLTTQSNLDAPMYVVGYQYDIIRRKRGHLGLGVQFNLFDATASIRAAAQVTSDGVHHAAVSASSSLLVPIPVAGPEARFYLTNSPRVFVEGNIYGMYFFGYGNFVSSGGTLGFTVNRHLTLNAGYQLGSRLVVNNSSSADRIGLHLTHTGAIVGMEFSF